MSYTRLRYHVIFATKGRAPVLGGEVERAAHEALRRRADEIGTRVLAIGGIEDHVHLVIAIPPTLCVADVVQKLKIASSHAVNKAGFIEGLFAWQRGYSAFTIDPIEMRPVLQYVRNQRQHHYEQRLIPHYESLESPKVRAMTDQ